MTLKERVEQLESEVQRLRATLFDLLTRQPAPQYVIHVPSSVPFGAGTASPNFPGTTWYISDGCKTV